MIVSDFLSRFSSDNKDEEPIPFLTDTSYLDNDSYISYLDNMSSFNYETQQGICTKHSSPFIRSLQKITIPTLFKGGTTNSGAKQRASLLRDPPTVLASKMSVAVTPADLGTTGPKKRGRDRLPVPRVKQITLPSLIKKQMHYKILMRHCQLFFL